MEDTSASHGAKKQASHLDRVAWSALTGDAWTDRQSDALKATANSYTVCTGPSSREKTTKMISKPIDGHGCPCTGVANPPSIVTMYSANGGALRFPVTECKAFLP